jgi:hypothetical protein
MTTTVVVGPSYSFARNERAPAGGQGSPGVQSFLLWWGYRLAGRYLSNKPTMSIKVPMAGQWPRIRGGGGVLARDGASAITAIRERLRT